MTILVETPPTRLAERRYAASVVLGEWLGLPWRLQPGERRDVRISLDGVSGGEVLMPDLFFRQADLAWLDHTSLPPISGETFDAAALGAAIRVVDHRVPRVFAAGAGEARLHGESLRLPIDVFGSAFLMLTRYEEWVRPDRDEHDRFPGRASLAARSGFLDRPVVDEQVELLSGVLQRALPRLPRRDRRARSEFSCDVDRPFDPKAGSWSWLARRIVGDLIRPERRRMAWRRLGQFRGARRGERRGDPLDTFGWMMDRVEAVGHRLRFNFMATDDPGPLDVRYRIGDPWIRRLLREIHRRGHWIGLHGSYESGRDAERLRGELAALQRVLEEERIGQEVLEGRQHYLRWCPRRSAGVLEAAGLRRDSTLSFADLPGFRCGTCRSFPMYDLSTAAPLRLRQQPLVCMEGSVLDPCYLGLPPLGEGGRMIRSLRAACRAVCGDFTLLWHNSQLQRPEERALLESLLSEESGPDSPAPHPLASPAEA